MNEESILILNMLREGKITAEQADSLLRAVRENPVGAAPPPPAAPPAPTPDPAAMAVMQVKLAELQGKLGDLQGKLGAAQAAKTAGQAASLAGKVLDHIPRPELDMGKINRAVDEAMRGLNSLKNDALKTAKSAARQASQEARKTAREGRKAFKFEFSFDGGDAGAVNRPANSQDQAQAVEIQNSDEVWDGAESVFLENPYGNISVRGSEREDNYAHVSTTRTAWANSEADARVLLQQVFIATDVHNGRWRARVIAPADARERVTVDCEFVVPRHLPLEVVTTFGGIEAQDVSAALTLRSASGAVTAANLTGAGKEARLTAQSGRIQVMDWASPGGSLSAETTSGGITARGLAGQTVGLSSRNGDVSAQDVEATGTASFESASGDVSVTECAGGTRGAVRTQSGQAKAVGLRADQVHVETVSGDMSVRDTQGVLTVKTISGDVEAEGIVSPAVSLVTVSGDARWRFAGPFAGSFAGTTVSGDLTLAVGPGCDARVEMNTTSGALSLSAPASDLLTTERHVAGTLTGGTGSVRLQSVSGDLAVSEG